MLSHSILSLKVSCVTSGTVVYSLPHTTSSLGLTARGSSESNDCLLLKNECLVSEELILNCVTYQPFV